MDLKNRELSEEEKEKLFGLFESWLGEKKSGLRIITLPSIFSNFGTFTFNFYNAFLIIGTGACITYTAYNLFRNHKLKMLKKELKIRRQIRKEYQNSPILTPILKKHHLKSTNRNKNGLDHPNSNEINYE